MILALFICLPVAIVVFAADRLGAFDGSGAHTRRGVREAAREHAAGSGHLGRAGRLDTELLDDPWDLTTQLRAQPGADGPHCTGEFPAMLIDARQETERLAAKYMTAPEVQP